MNSRQCLKYLERIQKLGIKFGLDNVRTVLSRMGDPHMNYPSILVAGTNGKGSVCAMLTRILTLHGYRTGLFTSPHLIHVEERFKVGETRISEQDFCRHLTFLSDIIGELMAGKKLLTPPTYFELMSLIAFAFFKEQKVDMAVLEVGMGGRFDATNVVHPSVSVITTISAEHQRFLGETLSQIAFEKAGIIRPGVPVVCGVEPGEAYDTIQKKAEECGSPFIGVFSRKDALAVERRNDGCVFEFLRDGEYFRFAPSLRGEHQGRNAAVAITASQELNKAWRALDTDTIIQGIESVKWEGRLEALSQKPLLLVDGAHNEEGVKALGKYMEEFVPHPRILVFAAMRGKKIEEMADILFPLADKVILTQFSDPRAASPEEVREKALKHQERIVLEPEVEQALGLAIRAAGTHGAVCAAGSLYLVGEVKKIYSPELQSRRISIQ